MPFILILMLALDAAASPDVKGPRADLAYPQPLPAVRAVLQEGERLLAGRNLDEALEAAEKALGIALQGKDIPSRAFSLHLKARSLAALQRPDDALAAWDQVIDLWRRFGNGPGLAEALDYKAMLVFRTDAETASALIDQVIATASKETARPMAAARVLNSSANRATRTGRSDFVERLATAALAILETLAPGSEEYSVSLGLLGGAAFMRHDLQAAQGYFERAVAIGERIAPVSADLAKGYSALGTIAHQEGDLAGATDLQKRSLSIWKEVAPDSLDLASSLFLVGVDVREQGDLESAEDFLRQALALRERLAPDSVAVSSCLSSLGLIAYDRGEMEKAQALYDRALTIQTKRAPDSKEIAHTLNNLGNVAWARGDLDAARDLYQRSLAIVERIDPGSREVANALGNLGLVAYDRGDLEGARELYMRALSIDEAIDPGSLLVAYTLNNLGNEAHARGDEKTAEAYHQRSLAIVERKAPGSLDVAFSLHNLGEVAAAQGDLERARALSEQALAIRERLAPGSFELANTLGSLADLAVKRGDLRAAEEYLSRAWVIVRGQRRAVSGDEAGRAFAASHSGFATDLALVRLERGETVESFQALEEGRAQGLLRLVSQRELTQVGVPPDLWRQFEMAEQTLQRAASDLSEAGSEEAEREAALTAYTRARVENERLLAEVRGSVPGLQPRTFTFDEARRALPKGSIYITWLVGANESAVFAIPADATRPVLARIIAIGEKQLAGRVSVLRRSIEVGRTVEGLGGQAASWSPEAGGEALGVASHELFEILFPAEVRAAAGKAGRVILSPDGPLWEVPFAAMATKTGRKPAWFGLDKPISYTASLTLLALERERGSSPAPGGWQALVVGDPAPSQLPASAEEARRIAALYGARPLLGEAATEAAVRAEISQSTVVHLATHGYFHPRLPMSSGLMLAPPAPGPPDSGPPVADRSTANTENDGALQAWEFGRTLPLRAQIVVLSACETGRGEKVPGEGLVGLTRALQAAGALSVVATHWKVADVSTEELMVAFHENLRAGLDKDEALRRAMAATAAKPGTRSPFYWAGFFLTGDPAHPLTVPASP